MTEHILKTHNYAEYELFCWCFSRIFPKVFRTSILKENLAMDVPYFIKEHLWMSASDEPTLKKNLIEVNPHQSWPWKQNCTTVVAVVMILEVWTTEKVCCRWIFWKKVKPSHRKCMLLLQYLSDWCLHGVYIWQSFWQKNIST